MKVENFLNNNVGEFSEPYNSVVIPIMDNIDIERTISFLSDTNTFNGALKDNAIRFDITSEDMREFACTLSKQIQSIVYISTSWDSCEVAVYKDGRIYDNYKMNWCEIEPSPYKDDDDEDESYYDCNILVKDNVTGVEFVTCAGHQSADVFESLNAMIRFSNH